MGRSESVHHHGTSTMSPVRTMWMTTLMNALEMFSLRTLTGSNVTPHSHLKSFYSKSFPIDALNILEPLLPPLSNKHARPQTRRRPLGVPRVEGPFSWQVPWRCLVLLRSARRGFGKAAQCKPVQRVVEKGWVVGWDQDEKKMPLGKHPPKYATKTICRPDIRRWLVPGTKQRQ